MTAIQNLLVQLYMKRKMNIFTSLKFGIVTVGILFKLFHLRAESVCPYTLHLLCVVSDSKM